MTITTNVDERFGSASNTTSNDKQRAQNDLDSAQFWIYLGDLGRIDDGIETEFTNLRRPKDLTTNSSNDPRQSYQTAWNEVISVIMKFTKNLDPGQARIIEGRDGPDSLRFLLGRTNAGQPATLADAKRFILNPALAR